jgi:DNA-binding CsgD family transcriptional regulator
LCASRPEAHGKRVTEARSRARRTSAEAIELWSGLCGGTASLVRRAASNQGGYAVLANEPEARRTRRLTATESEVLRLAARGLSSKLIAYSLGLGPSVVSANLTRAAAKIGVGSHAELVRVAALLAGHPRASAGHVELSDAENDVLELLQRGLSNAEIAAARGRSIRTVANQVASILSKTKSSTRRALVAQVDA